ncbi:hypothetical protein B4N89_11780 [Embleya scabrispora]|uniref:Uncharacterized protein n=1 Tax=Embleya scabrispora TaxID=159449 RepID=A0A1T3NXW6_9ACTN|nr:hypothetical protein B4N89_11780 [Embleya scabrispora]
MSSTFAGRHGSCPSARHVNDGIGGRPGRGRGRARRRCFPGGSGVFGGRGACGCGWVVRGWSGDRGRPPPALGAPRLGARDETGVLLTENRLAAGGREGGRVELSGEPSRVGRALSAGVARVVAGGWCGVGPAPEVGRRRRSGLRDLGLATRRASCSPKTGWQRGAGRAAGSGSPGSLPGWGGWCTAHVALVVAGNKCGVGPAPEVGRRQRSGLRDSGLATRRASCSPKTGWQRGAGRAAGSGPPGSVPGWVGRSRRALACG